MLWSCRRPEIPQDAPPKLRDVVEACWRHEAAERPAFKEVVQALQWKGSDDAAMRRQLLDPCGFSSAAATTGVLPRESTATAVMAQASPGGRVHDEVRRATARKSAGSSPAQLSFEIGGSE